MDSPAFSFPLVVRCGDYSLLHACFVGAVGTVASEWDIPCQPARQENEGEREALCLYLAYMGRWIGGGQLVSGLDRI